MSFHWREGNAEVGIGERSPTLVLSGEMDEFALGRRIHLVGSHGHDGTGAFLEVQVSLSGTAFVPEEDDVS